MIYEILDASGSVINTIAASEDFVSSNYDHYRLFVPPQDQPRPKEDTEKEWRNSELKRTDVISQTPDWPNRDAYLVYRQELRDWPATPDFPDTRPVLGV